VAVIAATGGEPCPQLAQAVTQKIPIVFTAIQEGLVASLNHPGGNATGVTIFGAPAAAKRMQLLRDVVPNLAIIGYLTNPNNPNSKIELTAVEAAARSVGKEILILQASSESEIEAAFAKMGQQHGAALLSASDALFLTWRDKIASLAAHYRIPAIYYLREYAQAGGLMAYGNNLTEVYRLVGVYVGRILKGEKPADLPVVLSTKYELVINLKAAKALGLTIPPGVFSIADEVIE
jgi:putative ABC transport system substrate-binding protein